MDLAKLLDKAMERRELLHAATNAMRLVNGQGGAQEVVNTEAFLQRAFKKDDPFDLIVLDPPSFARHEGKVFQVKRDLPKLIALSTSVLNGRKVDSLERVGQDRDFPGSNSFKESYLAGLWVKFI